jgi:Na+/H+ antiporter NhaD/arsenite permease-like protein
MTPQELIALAVFCLTYALIIDGRIHRAVVAMVGAAIVVLASVVPWDAAFQYIDFGTIFLLMGMMIIVNTAQKSGMFEFIAIKTARMAGGNPLKLLVLFSLVTAVVSAFLDNVTTVLLLTPLLIYIAGVMEVSVVPYCIAEIFASNIGGAATLIGDPPNIMIGSAANLSFNDFLVNMGPVVVVDLFVVVAMMAYLNRHTLILDAEKKSHIDETLGNLDEDSAITDRILFYKSLVIISAVVILFLLHDSIGLEPEAIALIAAAVFLFWSRIAPDDIFREIEWTALFFFGGLFIVVGALVQTGLISDAASVIAGSLGASGSNGILIIAWFSALASAFVDNIPLTATMIPLIQDLGTAMDVSDLWWALSLGACLGGNGTAIGASANIVVLGIAEENDIAITFKEFIKMGMPVLFVTVGIGSFLLLLRAALFG